MNITLEQRNAQKLFNLLNVANENIQDRDIYFYLKYYVKTMLNQYKLYPKDQEILLGHINAFSNELISSQWDINKFDPNKYDKFLQDFYKKVDFRKIDTEFMFKCKDILDVSPVKNDLYKRRMAFFDKKLPKISPGNILFKAQIQNNNLNNNFHNNNNINANQGNDKPINPFASINSQSQSTYENPYGNGNNDGPYGNMGQSSYQENNNLNSNGRNILRGQRPGNKNMNNINNVNNMNNVMNMYNIENKKKIIPEDIKQKIINELKMVSEEIQNYKIDNCKKHSIEALLLFKQIYPQE